jgi:outer membrane lipoprotein-sorting protein
MALMKQAMLGMFAACAIVTPAAGQTFDARTDAVYQKALAVNNGLQSYTAHIAVETRVFFGRFSLDGTVYRRGDQQLVVFDRVPAIARAAVSKMPTISGPGDWPRRYAMSIAARTADTTTFRLIPLRAENARSIDVVVSNASGLELEYVWSTVKGETITSDETYENINGYELVQSSTTTTRGGGINSTSTTAFTSYALNATVPDSILASTPPDPQASSKPAH